MNNLAIERHGAFLRLILILILSVFTIHSHAVTVTVYVYNNNFSINPPGESVESPVIQVGDSVRWYWLQGNHTTTSVSGSSEVWNQAINSVSTEFLYQFNSPGVYWYYCIPHGSDSGDGTASGMSGTITVIPAGSGACCLPDGTCYVTGTLDCENNGGEFQGVGSSCEDINCPISFSVTSILDNTLYEDPTGGISNGLGEHLICGSNNQGLSRRALIKFDLSEIPLNAIITDVTLGIYCENAGNGVTNINIHKNLSDWGEGTSNAGGNEYNGTSSTIGDATWIHTFYNTQFWSNPGGDFTSSSSAVAIINSAGQYVEWSDVGMLNDVLSWHSSTSQNHGWILISDELVQSNELQFASRDASVNMPYLNISYYVPTEGACCQPDGTCYTGTELSCIDSGGVYQGNGTTCEDVNCLVVLTPYQDPLPLPAVATPIQGTIGGKAYYEIAMTEQFQQLHSDLPLTRVWGYNGTFPGPTIEAYKGDSVTVIWRNDLRYAETGQLRTEHALLVDTCLHGPDHTGQMPVATVHLHGGKVAPESDGNPDLVFAPGEQSPLFEYPNDQSAATLWYHDHGLGITRLNVMMGMAGLYLIRDDNEQSLNLPSGEFEIPLVFQDRSFNADGSLYYPEEWQPHFFGNTILVNGMVWPYHVVKQGVYRFRLLNGSNSRTYNLSFSNGMSFDLIATDLGLRETPLTVNAITFSPGERVEILVDFTGIPSGTEIILENDAPAPFPGLPGIGVVPNTMKFIVSGESGFIFSTPDTLESVPIVSENMALLERTFELITIPPLDCGDHTHPIWTINGLMWDDITEYPELGTTEIWTWKNQSGVSHPMHMHLVKFQILDRRALDSNGSPTGPVLPPEPHELGWKDTANSPPGYQTRVIATFEGYTGLFPYHCHILEHEDHEMMRQFEVVSTGCTDPSANNYDPIHTIDDGSCIYNVTFQLDMNDYTGSYIVPEVNGTFNDWCGACNPMTDPDGDGIYSATLTLPLGTYEYKYSLDNWAVAENFSPGEPCTNTTNELTNRIITIDSATLLPEVCWNSCSACPTSECQSPNSLDVIEIDFGGSNPRVNATWVNPEGTNSCEVRGGRISPATAGTTQPVFANLNNTQIVSQTNGSTINFNIGLFNNPNIPFFSGQTYGYEVRCTCADGSGMSEWSGISPSSTFVVPPPPALPSASLDKRVEGGFDFSIYPNPARDVLEVQLHQDFLGSIVYRISDNLGRTLVEETVNGSRTIWRYDLRSLPSGLYHLSIQTPENLETARFVISE